MALYASIVGFCTGIVMPLSMAAVASNVKKEDAGVAMGVRLTGSRIADFTNPVFFGAVSQSFGITNAFLSGGLFLILGDIFLIIWFLRNNFYQNGT